MAPTETYGSKQHGVYTRLSGAGVSSGEGGRRQPGVIIGRGNPDANDYEAGVVKSLELKSDIEAYFGSESELGVQLEASLINGASRPHLRGVAPAEISVTDEQLAGGSGTLSNAPILAQQSEVKATITDDAGTPADDADDTTTEYSVNFVYETMPTAPSGDADTVNINPNSGEFEGPTSDDYSISYKYHDWDAAIEAAAEVIQVAKVGGMCVTTSADSVKSTLSSYADEDTTNGPAIRHDYRLTFVLAPGMANATGTDGSAVVDAEEYSDSIDNDAFFIATGAHISESTGGQGALDAPLASSTPGIPHTVIGGVFGRMLGNQMTNPIYEDQVEGYGDISLATAFGRTEAQALRDAETIPMMDSSRTLSGEIELGGNHSTSSATDYVRDFHRLTIKDNVNLNFLHLARAARSEILVTGEDGIANETEQAGMDIFRRLAEQNIIEGAKEGQQGGQSGLESTQPAESTGTADEGGAAAGEQQTPYDVTVTNTDVDELTIEYEFVPTQVVKQVNNEGAIRDQVSFSTAPGTAGSGTGTGGA